MKVHPSNAAWEWLGDVWAGGRGNSQLLGTAPPWTPPGRAHGLCLPPAVPAHIHVPELLLGLGSVERGTWHPHALILLMMDSTQHVPLLFKEGMGTAQNCTYLFFYSCREKRVTEGKG